MTPEEEPEMHGQSDSLDATDITILRLLQDDGRMSNAEIARRVDMAPSAIYKRIQKLEDRGVIRGYTALLRPGALGYALVAFVRLQAAEGARPDDFVGPLAGIPEVQELHRVVGEDCFFLKVRVQDTDALATLLDGKIAALPAVASTRTTIALSTAKETQRLPLTAHGEEPADGDADDVAPVRSPAASTG